MRGRERELPDLKKSSALSDMLRVDDFQGSATFINNRLSSTYKLNE